MIRPLPHVAEVRLQGGRVHRDQHVGRITRSEDVVVGEVDLEGRHPGQRALRRPDLRGEVRERRQVVAERRRLLGEPVTGQLHAVPGVARQPDDHPVELLHLLGHALRLLSPDLTTNIPGPDALDEWGVERFPLSWALTCFVHPLSYPHLSPCL